MTNHLFKNRFWINIIGAILILGFTLCGWTAAAGQQNQAEEASKNSLWSIQNGSYTIYLLGSIHVLKSDAYPLAGAIEDAYSASQKVVFETDMNAMTDPAVAQKMMQLALYPEGQTLDQNLGADTLNKLKAKMKELGLPMQQFGRFKPWFIALTLAQLELQRLGFNPAYGIDMHFYGRTKKDAKQTGFLEPIDFQINLLGKMNAANQDALLAQTLEEMDIVTELAADMLAYWKSGDAENLYHLLNRSFEGHSGLRDKLLIQRNKRWVSGIEALMKENKNVLVIVGAGHLVGPDSVIDLFRKKGHQVKQH
jgi:uncharacterized protein YbaP (TraB family)